MREELAPEAAVQEEAAGSEGRRAPPDSRLGFPVSRIRIAVPSAIMNFSIP